MFRATLYGSDLTNSEFLKYRENNKIYISTFVLAELYDISIRQQLPANFDSISNFLSIVKFEVYQSNEIIKSDYSKYIYDIDDAQILQDSIDINADYLLTNNIKDFNIKSINDDFCIKAISDLRKIQ